MPNGYNGTMLYIGARIGNNSSIQMDETEEVVNDKAFFREKEDVLIAVNKLCTEPSYSQREIILDGASKSILKYQEQPQLLGPHLEELLQPLNNFLVAFSISSNKSSEEDTHLHQVCKFIQVCCRVRGFKQVAKYLPHEVFQLEPCCVLLAAQDQTNHDSWEVRYVLLLWLSSLVLIPFDLSSMDSNIDNGSSVDLLHRLIFLAKAYIADPGPTREAAGFCLANLLTRPDMETHHLRSFVDWVTTTLQAKLDAGQSNGSLTNDYFGYIGVLSCLNQIFKRGHRSKIGPLAHQVYVPAAALANIAIQTVERKLLCKLIQRIGMTFLPPKEAMWRYHRGQRSLHTTLQSTAAAPLAAQPEAIVEEAEEEDVVFSDELEDIIGIMLSFLSDKDTIVRWSAAKGMGRITMRLSKALASDIVDAIMGLFEDANADTNWHGGCLAIAELSRRGLLLPEKLAAVTALINQGMHFDILRGQHSIGAHVRDAACYVCWAFARAYSPKDLAAYRAEMFSNMLLTSLFDREVNCRRAASAALQEFVGRQGPEYFTASLSIITIADFFAVGNRSSAFQELSTVIAALDGKYLTLFLDHLCNKKFNHWDDDIRVLASRAIARLLMVDGSSMSGTMSALLPTCSSARLADRHGALLSISTILQCAIKSPNVISSEAVGQLETILCTADKLRLFRGKGGELVRAAICNVIEALARARIKVAPKTQVALVDALNEHLRQPHEKVQQAAQSALRMLLYTCFGEGLEWKEATEKLQNATVAKYLSTLKNESNVAVTRGFCLALGVLPGRLVMLPAGRFDAVLDMLEQYAASSKMIAGDHDTETSRNSLLACIELAERLCQCQYFTLQHLQRCFNLLFRAGEDYSIDKRGDTGSWCRSLALKGVERLVYASFPRIFRNGHPLNMTTIKREETNQQWLTAFGLGTVTNVANQDGSVIATVSFTARSLGAEQSQVEDWIADSWQPSGHLILSANPTILDLADTKAVTRAADSDASCADWDAFDYQSVLSQGIAFILKQMAEKLDAVREVAGSVLAQLVRWCIEGPYAAQLATAERRQLLAVLQAGGSNIQWGQPGQVFPILSSALGIEEYFQPIFAGLIISVGGVSKSISKCAAECLLKAARQQLDRQNGAFFIAMADGIVDLFNSNRKVDRVILPLIKTMELLLRNCALDLLTADYRTQWVTKVHEQLQIEIRRSSNVSKISTAIDVMSLLLSMECGSQHLTRHVLQALLRLLAHKYPKVRKHCAEVLYLLLLSSADQVMISAEGAAVGQHVVEQCSNLLLLTTWDGEDTDSIFQAMNELLQVLGYDEVVKDAAAKGPAAGKKADELDSYEALVRDAGY